MSDEQRPSGDAARFDEVQSLRAEVEALRSRVTGSAQRAEQDQKIRQLQSAQATLSTQNERLVRTLKDAREQIVAYYARYYGQLESEAFSRQPFAYRQAPPQFDELDAATAFRVLKNNLDALGTSVPMLYKQYTDLCEPGGARFLAFGVDPAFSDSVDGLIEVDLQRLRPKKRERYLSPAPPARAVAGIGADAAPDI